MLDIIFKNLTKLPAFKGKLTLLNKLYENGSSSIEQNVAGKMIPGHLMQLYLADRIQRRMFIKKSHEPETEFHMHANFKLANTFIDIGANVGYFSMMAKAVNSKIKVYSFEPNPNNIKKIKQNIEINKFDNINISDMCLSDNRGNVQFSVPPLNESGWGRITNDHLPLDNFTTINATAISLDILDEENYFQINSPLFIKMDVEGNEFKVLKGAVNFIKKYSPTFCIELNEPCLIDCQTSSAEIISFLKNIGYDCYYIQDKNLIKTEKMIDNYEYLNYWFIKA